MKFRLATLLVVVTVSGMLISVTGRFVFPQVPCDKVVTIQNFIADRQQAISYGEFVSKLQLGDGSQYASTHIPPPGSYTTYYWEPECGCQVDATFDTSSMLVEMATWKQDSNASDLTYLWTWTRSGDPHQLELFRRRF